jgi:hypothetical protein
MTTVTTVRWMARRVIGGLCVAVLVGSVPAVAPAAMPGPVLDSMRAQALEAAQRKESLSPAQRKVASHILGYAWPEAIPRARTLGPLEGSPEVPWHAAGRLHVVVRVTGTASADTVALHAAGLEIEIVNHRFSLVQGWVAEGAVPAIASLEIVKAISPAWPAEHSAGSVTTEGDHASRADLVRQLGYDGSGVTVGVISDGIDSLAVSQASGDLPSVTVPPDPRCQGKRRRGNSHTGDRALFAVRALWTT